MFISLSASISTYISIILPRILKSTKKYNHCVRNDCILYFTRESYLIRYFSMYYHTYKRLKWINHYLLIVSYINSEVNILFVKLFIHFSSTVLFC